MTHAIDTARASWPDGVPDWVAALARACDDSSQSAVARRLGRSQALISQVIRGKYPGNLTAVEEAVRGAFMGATVECPALGTMPSNVCQAWRHRARDFGNSNPLRVTMFRACNRCPRNARGGGNENL
jgi:hypothetical protein